jgi:hypothetical protein
MTLAQPGKGCGAPPIVSRKSSSMSIWYEVRCTQMCTEHHTQSSDRDYAVKQWNGPVIEVVLCTCPGSESLRGGKHKPGCPTGDV